MCEGGIRVEKLIFVVKKLGRGMERNHLGFFALFWVAVMLGRENTYAHA